MLKYLKHTMNVAFAMSAGLLLISCGPQDKKANYVPPPKIVKKKQDISFCVANNFISIDPGTEISTIDLLHVKAAYDGLFGFKKGTAMMEPRLAESFTVSDDGLTYTFKIRKGVAFHTTEYFTPTRPLNADDVVFSFKRQVDKKDPYYRVEYETAYASGVSDNIKEIKKIDDYTVQMKLKKAMATFIPNLMMSTFSIVSKEYFDKMRNVGDLKSAYTKPIGTGAWIFQSVQEDVQTTYIANKNYWRTTVKGDKLIFKVIENKSQYIKSTEEATCDITDTVSPKEQLKAKQYTHVNLMHKPKLETWHVQLNYKRHKKFNNPLIMQAISHALNRQRISQSVFNGQATIADSLIPTGLFGHIEDTTGAYKYDLKKAKALMAKAGHKNGRGLPKLTYLVRAQVPEYRQLGLEIKKSLKQIGIKVELSTVPWSTLLDLLYKHKYDIVALSWTADTPDPDNFYSNMLGRHDSANYPAWHNRKFEKLRLQSQTVIDPEKRLEIYKKINDIYVKHLPIIPLVYNKAYVAVRSNIDNYYVGPVDGTDALAEVVKR